MKLPFTRRRTEVVPPRIVIEWRDGDHLLTCSLDGVPQPVERWAALRPEAAVALGEALAAAEDCRRGPDERPLAGVDGERLRLNPAFVAGLDSAAAATLDLPPPTPFALDLRPEGNIADPDFRVAARWIRPGGAPVRVEVQGALLLGADGPRRIPEPLWSLHRAAAALSQPLEQPERFAALAALREAWPEDARAAVEDTGYLSNLRVHHAASLSLKLGRRGPFDFDPVLFSSRAVAEAAEAGREVDEDADNTLSPAAQRLFAEDRFRREGGGRPVYVLRDGEYVFIDPSLRPALDAVRRLQDAPEPERRAFVLNPRRVLRERLGNAAGADVDALFVETEQFSARVAGADVWRAPVLPWLTPAGGNDWLPRRFGLKVGEDYFVLPPENVAPVIARVEAAAEAGQPTANVGDLLESLEEGGPPPPSVLPVNAQTREAAAAFRPFAEAFAQAAAGVAEAPAAFDHEGMAGGSKVFLIVHDNLDEVEFAPSALEMTVPLQAEPPVEPPRRLSAALKPHQLEGLRWLAASARAGRPGALLADDMGLGKTLQAIAFMAWLQEEAEAGRRPAAPFLVVAPTGLLGNWRDEIGRHLHLPRLGPLLPAFGTELKRLREEDGFAGCDIETGCASLKAESWREAGVVLTTYETLRDYHFSFARTRFGLIVYDEIQKLKNPASQLTRAAKTLNAGFVLGMTGTPVENRLQDLWSISDVIAPGLLGSSRDFERRHPPSDAAALARLKASLTEPRDGASAYMLRRLKGEVLEGLPKKTIHRPEPQAQRMPPVQAQRYGEIVVRAAAQAAAGTSSPGDMLKMLAALRSASLHPLDPRQAPSDLDAYAAGSARLAYTLKTLEEIAARQEKALVFVEDLAMQERLAGLIQSRFRLARPPQRINGGVPGPKRQDMVRAFQERPSVFDVMILSPKAGGVGLTLTAANHVIHLSRWWNPAVEDQATDRVHRIGQSREVHVYLPLAVHPDPSLGESSFDLRLDALIERKRQLTRDLFLPPESTDEDLATLFREVSAPAASKVPNAASVDGGVFKSATPGLAPPDSATAPEPARLKGTLSLPRSAAVRPETKAWRLKSGDPRPTAEILRLLPHGAISHVHIRDPYALASAAHRSAQAALIRDLCSRGSRIEAVTIEYMETPTSDVPDGQGRTDMSGRLLASGPARVLLNRRNRGRGAEDFHDRSIDIDVRDGETIRRHTLFVGRGAEALYDKRRECTVTYVPPSI